MKTRKRILSIVLTIATLLLLVLDIPVTAAGTKKVDVLFTHDTHSHLDSFSTIVDGQQKEVGGFAKIKTLMDEKKKTYEMVQQFAVPYSSVVSGVNYIGNNITFSSGMAHTYGEYDSQGRLICMYRYKAKRYAYRVMKYKWNIF